MFIFIFFSDLRSSRNALLAMFNMQTASPEKMEEASSLYFALIQGLFHVPEAPNQSESSNKGNSTEEKDKQKTGEKDKKEKSGLFCGIVLMQY